MKVINHKNTTHNNQTRLISHPCYKSALQILLVIAIQHLMAKTALGSDENTGNETDRAALLAVKRQLMDHPEGVLSSWNHSLHHCHWEGVACGRKHGRVIALELYSRGLSGTISPFIGNLSFLKNITLYNNSLQGKIPSEIGKLLRLQSLRLYNNTLDGEIPYNLSSCISLQFLSIGYNNLQGKLPSGLRSLKKLYWFAVHYNNLIGPVFQVIANLTSLETISAGGNSFTGSIGDYISRMPNLTIFAAGQNQLSGVVPASVFNKSSLRILQLGGNQLQGKIPVDLRLTLPRLENLNLENNYFSSSIPASLTNLTRLELIELEINSFTGTVPQGFGQLHSLNHLNLFNNHLSGDITFMSELVNCSKLEFLSLRRNNFTGHLPKSVANLSTSLSWFAVGRGQIYGEMPAGVTNLISLKHLDMSFSELTGSIPHDIGKLQELEWIDLSSNKLTGRIPYSFGNLSRLSDLYLDHNKLQGSIPPTLGECRSLIYLNLSFNELNGTFPIEVVAGFAQFVELDVSRNYIEGSLPVEIGKQRSLVKLHVSENKFSGVLSAGLVTCPALVELYMEGNYFHGSIPPSFTALRSLQKLSLSSNNFSGQIPEYFAKFPLIYLNLSFNDFEGSVPTTGVFANGSAVSLDGNRKLCGGIPELQLPRCVSGKERKARRKRKVLELTIPIICAFLGILIMVALLFMRRKKVSSNSEQKEGMMRASYSMLLKATDGFSSENLLGKGTYGSVFKGILEGKSIAVKVLNMQHRGAGKSFMAECNVLRNVRHRNLVRIITACSSIDFHRNDFKALVFKFMPNGSLDQWLHQTQNLGLLQRVSVAIDVAYALHYLHHECEVPIVHCDLKPSNILLDDDMVAHVGDFGLAKILAHQSRQQNQSSTVGVRGTVGYAAPEYGLGSEASPEGDIYSYGILLLELVTGKRPTDSMFKEEFDLHMYAEAAAVALTDQVLQIVDPRLKDGNISEEEDDRRVTQHRAQRRLECIVSMVSVGVACSNYWPQNRMKITEAISRLQAARDNLLNARHPRNSPRDINPYVI